MNTYLYDSYQLGSLLGVQVGEGESAVGRWGVGYYSLTHGRRLPRGPAPSLRSPRPSVRT